MRSSAYQTDQPGFREIDQARLCPILGLARERRKNLRERIGSARMSVLAEAGNSQDNGDGLCSPRTFVPEPMVMASAFLGPLCQSQRLKYGK